MFSRLPLPIRIWFVLDIALALLLPIHWWLGVAEPLFGLPRVLVYLWGTMLFVSASVVAAYFADPTRSERA